MTRSRILAVVLILFSGLSARAQFCAIPYSPPAPPTDVPVKCKNAPGGASVMSCDTCQKCTGSPSYIATGNYATSATDLSISTVGFPLTVSRRYDSSAVLDGPLGIGWSVNLVSRIYYARYLYASPSVYHNEAYAILPNGERYLFSENLDGSFSSPDAPYDRLTRNLDGTFDLRTADGATRYHFAANSQLEWVRDAFANELTFSYDGSGRLQRVADGAGSGRYLDVYYGANGRINNIADSSGRHVAFGYGTDGTLTSVIDAASRTTTYSYTNVRFGPLLTHVNDAWGRTVTAVTYDGLGRTSGYMEDGESYTYSYDPDARKTTKSDTAGHLWTFLYDADGHIVSRRLPGATVASTVSYNPDGTLAQTTDEVGVTTTYAYAGSGRIWQVTKDAGGALQVRFDYAYGDSAFPEKVTSIAPMKANAITGWENHPDWQGWRYDYYPAGSAAPGALWHVYRVRSDGTTADIVMTYTYNSHGQVLSATDAAGAVTDYSYDAAGDLETLTRPANNAAGTRPVTTYGYDALGRMTSVILPDHNTGTSHDVEYSYDPLDRITEVRDHFSLSSPPPPPPCGGEVCPPPPLGQINFATTSYAYDRFDAATGLLFADVTDPNANVTHQGYDTFGRLVRSIDSLGNTTSYVYAYRLLSSITDANANVTAYAYDAAGRLSMTTFPDGAAESYSYTSDGLLATKTDRKLQTIGYSYDRLKRLVTKSYPSGGGSVTFAYAGQKLTQVTDSTVSPSETHTFAYDDAFRLTTNAQGTRGTITYTYTPTDAVATMAVTGVATTTYSYYPDGSPSTIGWSPVSGTFQYAYTLGGQYDTITFPNGQTRTYAYDVWNRLTSVANVHPVAGNLATYTYGYDAESGGATNRLDQRTSMVADVPSQSLAGATTNYRYDNAYQLTGVDDAHSSRWTYDGIGNRTTSTLDGLSTRMYTYQKIGSNPSNWQRLLSFSGGPAYTYDANGNTDTETTSTAALTYTWDVENRLRAIANGASSVAAYTYDYQGRRSGKTTATTTRYLYDGLNLIGEGTALPVLTNQYLYGPGIDEPLAMTTSGGAVYYYDVDALGSIALVNDASGTVVDSYLYDAWGFLLSETETVAQPFRYTARERGEVEGQHFYRARFLSSPAGRFLSEDPLRQRTQRHTYSYGRNAPIEFTDPTGLTWKDRRFGYPDEFWRWFHRRYKRKGDGDADSEQAEEAYEEWKRFERKPKKEPPPPDADDPEHEGDPGDAARFCVPCQINRINKAVSTLIMQAFVDQATRLLRTCDLMVSAAKNAKPCACGK